MRILLKSVSLPEGITAIGYGTFTGCNKLAKVSIPDNVTMIGNSAFLGCEDLKEVVLPEGLTLAGGAAFLRCTRLTSVTCKATTPPSLDDAFMFTEIPLYVPAKAVEAYKASEWAKFFGEILAIEDKRPTSHPAWRTTRPRLSA